jgi:excisionase family DNA binding protein
MPISKKESMRKAAPTRGKAAPAKQHHDTRPHLGAAGRKKISSTAKRLIKEIPIRQRMENKRAREEEMAAELPLTDGPWLTILQVAKRLDFSEITVRRWVHTGGLRYRRFSKTIKIPLWELERWSGGRSNAA